MTSVPGAVAPPVAAAAARRRALAWTGALSVASVAVVLVVEPIGSYPAPVGFRGVLEVSGLFLNLVAALMLAIPGDDLTRPAREAFIAALAVIAVTNAVFGVAATLHLPLIADEGLAAYPWLAARYLAGVLFVVAGLERPRWTLARYLTVAITALVLVDIVLIASSERLVRLVELRSVAGRPEVVVLEPVLHAVLQLLPSALFVLGAWMAARLHRRTGGSIFLFLSVALVVQAVAQLHQIVRPSFLGPVVTSADVLRSIAFVVLFVGALVELRTLYRDRTATVRAQGDDLLAHDVLAEELERVLDSEEDFRAIVSHELATPVATIRAFAHVLDRSPELADGRARHAVDGIRAEAARLGRLIARIDELRDLERADFACELRPVRLAPILDECAAFVRGLPGVHPVDVHTTDLRVDADPVRLGQALRNILTNAARYAPPGTPIGIRAVARHGMVRVEVVDAGPGVPLDERPAVTRRYARGSAGREVAGTGLGLYVASRIAEAHGGRITLDDAGDGPGTGTRVTIVLPATYPQPGTDGYPARRTASIG